MAQNHGGEPWPKTRPIAARLRFCHRLFCEANLVPPRLRMPLSARKENNGKGSKKRRASHFLSVCRGGVRKPVAAHRAWCVFRAKRALRPAPGTKPRFDSKSFPPGMGARDGHTLKKTSVDSSRAAGGAGNSARAGQIQAHNGPSAAAGIVLGTRSKT